jgi:alpha-1,3-rhamnosyl/mannosyltransferase
VLTIHDVSYARHPEWYPYRLDRFRQAFYRRCAMRADVILTDSAFSRDEIIAAYGIAAERITVVPLGVGLPFSASSSGSADPSLAPYVLHVGDLHPRRNLEVAAHAVITLRRASSRFVNLRLLLAGTDRGVGDHLRKLVIEEGCPDAIGFEPAISDERLVALYRGARALIYPSRYEGFGLPVLEAMACGLPVIAARAGAVPEVVGEAGLLIEPDDVQGFTEALDAVLTDAMLATDLAHRAQRRAAEFTWERTAVATAAVYRRCAGDGPCRSRGASTCRGGA